MSHTTDPTKVPSTKDAAYSAVEVEVDRASDQLEPHTKEEAEFPEWPSSPQKLKRNTFGICIDFVLLLFPLAFIVLAVIAYTLDQKQTSEHGAMVESAMLLGPTVFPLAFAALGGRSMRNMALWKAERGSTIKLLENLHGSQSFVSAVSLAFTLRSFSAVSFSILLFWSLSPLGGQSSIRLLSPINSTDITESSVYYPAPHDTDRNLYGSSVAKVRQYSGILAASMQTAQALQSSLVDVWNHPRIPRIQDLESAAALNATGNNWMQVTTDESTAFTSPMGVSITGLQKDTVANFSIPYEYLYTNCSVFMRSDWKDVMDYFNFSSITSSGSYMDNIYPDEWPFYSSSGWLGSPDVGPNTLFNASFRITSQDEIYYDSSFFLVNRLNTSNFRPTNQLFYGTKDGDWTRDPKVISLYECSLHRAEVQANIVCESAACSVKQLRRPDQPRSFDFLQIKFLAIFMEHFSSMCGIVSKFSYHPTDTYIYGDQELSSYDPDNGLYERNWSSKSDIEVSQRLTEVLNAHWDSGRWSSTATRVDPFGLALLNKTTGEPYEALRLLPTPAEISRRVEIYEAHGEWITILLICSGILLILGIANIFFALQTSAPDIFGFVSSLTRENKYIDLPEGGTGLHGSDRSRLIKEMNVQLADVQGDKEVGYIALKSVTGDQGIETVRVKRGRLYI